MPRIIMHIDMNCYFASVEQQANPFLRGKPIGVTGKRSERSVLATASIEAKRLGVKTGMPTGEAKRVCPSIILIAGDPEKYSEITHRFNRILNEFTHLVEVFSVDESFLDITEPAQDYLGATVMAQMIKIRLREECGERITASVGIGANKFMAKAASESMKPDGLTVVRPEQAIPFLDTIGLQDVCGIGPRIARRLENLGITDFPALRKFPVDRLVEEFKNYGVWLHEAAHGRDASEVVPGEAEPKSVGHSYTLPKDTRNVREMKRYLLTLSDKVAWRMRRDGYVAHLVSAHVRYGDFSGDGIQHRFREPVSDGLGLCRIAWELIDRIRDPKKSVRLLGISAGMLSSGPEQPSLFQKERKVSSVLKSLDHVERRFGDGSWTRASLVTTALKPRSSGFAYDHEL